MGKKSLLLTYILWLFVGWLGLHHFYLGRDLHAFIWWSTFGGVFGVGWLRDLWRVPDYVDDANEEASYIDNFKQKVKRGTPQFNISRFIGQMLVGYFYGFLIRIAIPEELPIWTTGLIVPFGVAVGVYLVGNVGRETGSFKITLIVCYLSNIIMACVINQEPGIMYLAMFGSIAFQNYRKYRIERKPKQGICKRFFVICLGGCLVTGLWVSFFYYNASITTQDGETIKLRDAVNHFLNSPIWREFKDVMWELYRESKKQGWENMYDEFVKALDPTGEQNALKVLNLTEKASQEDIKKRYRVLAREWHPDKNPGDKIEAEKRFMEIQEAYECLSTIKHKRASKNQRKRDDYNNNNKQKV